MMCFLHRQDVLQEGKRIKSHYNGSFSCKQAQNRKKNKTKQNKKSPSKLPIFCFLQSTNTQVKALRECLQFEDLTVYMIRFLKKKIA